MLHMPKVLTALAATALMAAGATTATAANTPDPAPAKLDKAALEQGLQELVAKKPSSATAAVWVDGQRWGATEGEVVNPRQNYAGIFATGRAASITKPMVATMILQEVDRGRWTLDTLVSDIDPTLIPQRDDVTIRHLLNHTSGFQDYLGQPEFTDGLLAEVNGIEDWEEILTTKYTNRELLKIAGEMPWRFEPGTNFSYSNSNYVALGALLEETYNTSLDTLARVRIFAPSSMNRSSIPSTPERSGAHLVGTYYVGDASHYNDDLEPSIFGGAGALVTTPTDLAKYHYNLGAGRLISDESLAQMRTGSESAPGYGLGMFRVQDPCSPADAPEYMWGHDGAGFSEWGVSVASKDGRRSVNVLWSDRAFDETWQQYNQPGFKYFVDALALTCLAPEQPSEQARIAQENEPVSEERKAEIVDELMEQVRMMRPEMAAMPGAQ